MTPRERATGEDIRRQVAYRLVKDGRLFAVDWHGTLVSPSFQFVPQSGEVRRQIAAVLAALAGELGGWELARWFMFARSDHHRHKQTNDDYPLNS